MPYTFTYEQVCAVCGKPTHDACDTCHKPYCGHGACLFETGKMLTLPSDPRDEDYAEHPTWQRPEELCIECYQKAEGHAPFALWAETAMHTTLAFKLLEKGVVQPAGDAHSWYRPPSAGKMLRMCYGQQEIELDTFQVIQLLNFLKGHEQGIGDLAQETSKVLVAEARKRTEAAREADSGHIDYSKYE